MLTEDQKRYLEKIPAGQKVKICPFSKNALRVAGKIIQSIKEVYPNLEIIHMGASALGLAGQKDLDIYVFSRPRNFPKYLPGLIKLFANSQSRHKTFIEWNFPKEGYSVELYLTDPNSPTMQQQIFIFEALKNNRKLLSRYEQLKKSFDGKSYREYQRKKYEFFNKILACQEFG